MIDISVAGINAMYADLCKEVYDCSYDDCAYAVLGTLKTTTYTAGDYYGEIEFICVIIIIKRLQV